MCLKRYRQILLTDFHYSVLCLVGQITGNDCILAVGTYANHDRKFSISRKTCSNDTASGYYSLAVVLNGIVLRSVCECTRFGIYTDEGILLPPPTAYTIVGEDCIPECVFQDIH